MNLRISAGRTPRRHQRTPSLIRPRTWRLGRHDPLNFRSFVMHPVIHEQLVLERSAEVRRSARWAHLAVGIRTRPAVVRAAAWLYHATASRTTRSSSPAPVSMPVG